MSSVSNISHDAVCVWGRSALLSPLFVRRRPTWIWFLFLRNRLEDCDCAQVSEYSGRDMVTTLSEGAGSDAVSVYVVVFHGEGLLSLLSLLSNT